MKREKKDSAPLEKLYHKIEEEYDRYCKYVLAFDPQLILENAGKIHYVVETYNFMKKVNYTLEQAQRLVRLENTLLTVAANLELLCQINDPVNTQASIDFICNTQEDPGIEHMMDFH